MEFSVIWDAEAKALFPELCLCTGVIRNVNVTKSNKQIETLRRSVIEEAKKTYRIETLKDNAIVRAYRDLFWRLSIDPTKTRPSGEALLRRVLHGDEIPRISTAVDAYNLASLKTIIPISGFDLELVSLPLRVRFSGENEEFQGIGAKVPVRLDKRMLVVADKDRVLCVYPHRDIEATKITEDTKNILVIVYGAPNISKGQLIEAAETALSFIRLTSGGEMETVNIF